MAQTTPAGVRDGHRAAHGAHAAQASPQDAPMTHRQIMEALSGLLLGMFVAILSSTVVSNALPHIIAELGGGQSAYTWVVTASLLAMTATTPLWGKLADLFSKKVLVQIALLVYLTGSIVAGLSQSAGMLIACRVVQGVGMGGLSALAQIIMAAMIAPRDRGRYSGYLGATFAVATVGGPLLGGVITDTAWLGWRWCFYVGVPFAVIALIVLQRTLHLPVVKRKVKVDWAGAFFVAAAASLLLIWVTLAGDKYDWISPQTYAMVGGAIVLALLFLLVESRAKEPIIPLRLFRNRTITLASLGSLFVGIAMFGATIFLSQYFQLGRGYTPTKSGVMTIPMIAGLFVSSTFSGQRITRTGKWKRWLVSGGVLVTSGAGLLGTVRYDTPYWHVAVFMALFGLGIGMMMQNLVLSTQNQVAPRDLGAASSTVNFFRSLGGAIGVSALGALLAHRVKDYMADGLAALGVKPQTGDGSAIPELAKLPEPMRKVIEEAYGHGIGDVFLFAAPMAFLALVMVVFIKEVPLKTRSGVQEGGSDSASPSSASGGSGASGASGGSGSSAALGVEASPAAVDSAAGAVADPVAGGSGAAGSGAAGSGAGGSGAAPVDGSDAGSVAGPGTAPVVASVAEPGPDGGRADGGLRDGGLPDDGLPDGGRAIRGTIRTGDGTPVSDAVVTLISASGGQVGRAVAHAGGTYRLDTPGPGVYVLIASGPGHQPQAATLTTGDGEFVHDLRLAGTSTLSGTVATASAGQPVDGATVVVSDARGAVLDSARTGADGAFAFTELPPGTLTAAVTAPGYQPTAATVTPAAGTRTEPLHIELKPAARIRGVVRAAPEGRPVRDARVTLVDAAGNVVATTTTGEDGTYAFAELDTGPYTVTATGYPPAADHLTVNGEEVTGHDIELSYPEG